MNVNFYNFNKRENSTAQPTGDGTVISCIIKDGSAVVSPTIRLKWSGSTTPVYNYAYIGSFQRYYFAREWRYIERQWEVDLVCDVLASYKTNIGAVTKYVLRSASESSIHVLDNYYPATGEALTYLNQANFNWTRYGQAGGAVVATVIGKNAVPSGNYVAQAQITNPADVQLLINNLLDKISSEINITDDPNFGLFDLCAELIKIPSRMTDNLLKYVPDMMWFPFTNSNVSTPAANLKAGIHEVLALNKYGWITNPVVEFTKSISVSSYPGSDPDWEWAAPYASYLLHFMPFGDIPLDSFDVLRASSIDLTVRVDTISGIAVLLIYLNPGGGLASRLLTTRSAQLGIKLPYGGSSVNMAGLMQGAASATVAAVNYFTGAEGATAAAMLGSVANAAAVTNPSAYSSGATGTGASITGIATLYCRKMNHVPINNDEDGKPLCKLKQISSLSGYLKVSDGDITSMIATYPELMQVKSYLEGGFFYE